MGAEYTLHIKTANITEEDMELFFYNHIGSKYDPFRMFMDTLGDNFDKIMAEVRESTDVDKDLHNILAKYPGAEEAHAKWMKASNELDDKSSEMHEVIFDKFSNTPQFEVGSCSFLKAGLSDDQDKYIPDLIKACCSAIDDGRIIDDALISEIEENAKDAKKHSYYHTSELKDLINWLKMYKGEYVFSIAW